MKFVEKGGLSRQVRVQKLLCLMVVRLSWDNAVPRQNAPRISIRHKEGMPGRIEEDRVRRFRPHPAEFQQLAAELMRRQGKDPGW